jgi:hypothetical protein
MNDSAQHERVASVDSARAAPVSPALTDLVAVALASGAGIAIQIAYTRLFSITLWHHVAYLVVGVALLGAGLAGAHLTSRGGALSSAMDPFVAPCPAELRLPRPQRSAA